MGEVWKSSPQGPAELCGPGCTAQPAQGSLWGSLLPAGLFFSFTLKPNLATQPKRWCHMATSSEAVNPQCYYQDRDILNQLLRCRSVYIYGNPSGILNGKKRSFSFKNAPPTSFFFCSFTLLSHSTSSITFTFQRKQTCPISSKMLLQCPSAPC